MTITLPVRGTRNELKRKIHHLPKYLAGSLPDIYSIGSGFKAQFARAFFEKVHEAFLIKSEGGTDDTGTRWKPNTKATIAARKTSPTELRSLGVNTRSERHRGFLTASQNQLWKGIFRSTYLRLVRQMGDAAAKARAGQLAWAILKSQGAKTKLDVLGSRKLPIGIDSHRLEKSLRPGRMAGWHSYSPPKDQQVTNRRGGIEFKIRVPYALRFHKKRPIWPSQTRLAQTWARHASREALKNLLQTIPKALRG